MARQTSPQEWYDMLHVLNGTPKSATMIALRKDQLSGTGIETKIISLAGGTEGLPTRPVYRAYCDYTLLPRGFVTRIFGETERGHHAAYFAPTQKGDTFGFIAATLGIDWEATHETALVRVLGLSCSGGMSASPENRADTLVYLDQHGPTSIKKLAAHLALAPTVMSRHGKALEHVKLVTLEERKGNKMLELTGLGRNLLDTCLYPLLSAVYSQTTRAELEEAGNLLLHETFCTSTFRKAFHYHHLA